MNKVDITEISVSDISILLDGEERNIETKEISNFIDREISATFLEISEVLGVIRDNFTVKTIQRYSNTGYILMCDKGGNIKDYCMFVLKSNSLSERIEIMITELFNTVRDTIKNYIIIEENKTNGGIEDGKH